MSELATERAAVMERRATESAEATLRARARHCRQAMTTRRTSLQGPAPKSIEEAAKGLFPNLPPDELAEIIAAANQPVDRGRTVQTIATNLVKDLTRKFLDANRDASARDAWQHVLKHGQPTIREASFPALVSGVRKDLGISVGAGPRPKSGGPVPSNARARQRDAAPARALVSKRERAERLKVKRTAVEASAEAPAPRKNGKPRAIPATVADANGTATEVSTVQLVEARPTLFSDGDRITLEIGGEKLDARRAGGRWTCDVGDTVLESLMGRMLVGAGR